VQVRRIMANEALARNLTAVFCTSMPLPSGLGESFFETYGVPVIQLLGNIEVGIVMANVEKATSVPGLLGKALAAYEISVRDDSGAAVDTEVVGELFVRGPGAANCYLDPYAPVAKEGSDGWISTGDMVRSGADGNYEHCGRTVSAINVAGHKVFAEEVEREICAEPGVSAARVFGEPHDIYGTRLVAEVVVSEGYDLNERALRSRLREALASYKIPTEYIRRSELPHTPTGKVKRPQLQGMQVQ
jgi:acyl-coenzyme A synthetase/AMP-(fatty) acid ligase